MDMTSADIEAHLPLTPASFQIMLELAAGPTHGYAIMQASQLGPGTLYRTIQKLVDSKLIASAGAHDDDDERRVPYELNQLGLEVARAEAERLAVLVRIADERGLLRKAPRKSKSSRGAHA